MSSIINIGTPDANLSFEEHIHDSDTGNIFTLLGEMSRQKLLASKASTPSSRIGVVVEVHKTANPNNPLSKTLPLSTNLNALGATTGKIYFPNSSDLAPFKGAGDMLLKGRLYTFVMRTEQAAQLIKGSVVQVGGKQARRQKCIMR